jgi:hypothetical protein
MESHVKISGWLWIVNGVLGILGALCLAAAISGGGLISQDETAIISTSIVSACVGGTIIIGSIFDLIAGIGLVKFKSWARILAIILAILNLLAFPIGTALGIYTLWVMFNQDTPPLLDGGALS